MDVTYTTARQVSEHLPNCCMKPGTALLLNFCVPIFLQVCCWCYSHWPLLPFISRIPAPQSPNRNACLYSPTSGRYTIKRGRTTTLISLRHVIKGRASGWVSTLATGFASHQINHNIHNGHLPATWIHAVGERKFVFTIIVSRPPMQSIQSPV